MARTLLVTGTDTGVGKTLVTAWLASLMPPSLRVAIVKAVQTGAADPAVDGDEACYRAMLEGRAAPAGRTAVGQRDVTIRTLLSFPEPLAPTIAAGRAGETISYEALVRACAGIASRHDVTLIEGSGGLLVPLGAQKTFAELAADLGAGLVVVVRAGLGTINHTALTLEAAMGRGLDVELLVCNRLKEPAEISNRLRDPDGSVEAENVRFFAEHYPAIPLACLSEAGPAGAELLARLRPRLIGGVPSFLLGSSLVPSTPDEGGAPAP